MHKITKFGTKFKLSRLIISHQLLAVGLLGSCLVMTGCSDEANDAKALPGELASTVKEQNTMDVKQPAPVAMEKQSLAEKVELPRAVEPLPEVDPQPVITPKEPLSLTDSDAVDTPQSSAQSHSVEVESADADMAEAMSEPEVVVNGQQVYASCASCHGAQAEGGIGPKLAGQAVVDLVEKLQKYRAGEQLGPLTGMMAPMAAPLTDGEMQAVSEYAAAL